MKSLIFFTILSLSLSSSFAYADDYAKKLELWHNQVASTTAIIKSEDDLKLLESSSSWRELSSYAKSEFKSSLIFNDSGLASFKYDVLEAELSVSQIYSLLALFGEQDNASSMVNARIESDKDVLILNRPKLNSKTAIQQNSYDGGVISIGGDHKGYYCASRATCREEQGAICTSNC